ncbi:hypothetical protein SLEP1_g21638 [Rubroshorea leprosula]|uniref:Uncharacterized protein n=1 Tax=Rubroshorea leprosula TaxID=152421 RepID=A0AAV5JHB4_9ROSI|nr:hypothetical protein SLEP1_g21638 [Rubroshorea leprosula]
MNEASEWSWATAREGSRVHLGQGGLSTLTIVSEHTALFIPAQEAAPESSNAGDESSRSKFLHS